jgi:HSP20 family protein
VDFRSSKKIQFKQKGEGMNLVRWTPFSDMDLLQSQMNRLFENAFQGSGGTTSWVPAADIYESDNELVVHLDVPGVDPKAVEIRVENNVLTIRGERPFNRKESSENFHRVERLYGAFGRSFSLSTAVDSDKIRATYKEGVLSISLPKAEAAKPRKIQIASAVAGA